MVQDHLVPFRKPEMATRPKTFKSLLGIGLAALLLACMLPVVPAAAASLHQNFHANGGAFNLDQNACPPGMVHRRGSADCIAPQADSSGRNDNAGRNYDSPRRPGSSAFGLQFDTGDY